MQLWEIIILAFSGLGIFNSLALAVYLQISRADSRYKSIFLQIILLAFAIQVTHALIELFQIGFSFDIGHLYLLGVYFQGPSMYLFILTTLYPGKRIWPVQLLIHYLPWLIIALIPYDFDNSGLKEMVAIYLVGIQYIVYVLISIKPYLKASMRFRAGENKFYLIHYLFPAFALLWLIYPVSGIASVNYQIIESIMHAAFLYYLILLKIKEPKPEKNKYQFSKIDEKESQNVFNEITAVIREKELYLDPDITLAKLARKVNVSVNVLSQAINQNSDSNFRDFINKFRIQKAKQEIVSNTGKGFTIASVAYECGFNSLSAFNRAFKKSTGQTPSAFIKANR